MLGTIAILIVSLKLSSSAYCVNESTVVWTTNIFDEPIPSVYGTLAACLRNVPDAMLFPGYNSNQLFNISTQIQINNLISIDEMQSQATLDFFLYLTWIDARFAMPAFWANMSATTRADGIELSQVISQPNVQGTQLGIWTPSIMFPDSASTTVDSYYLKLYPKGRVIWFQHIIITLQESAFNYAKYPFDEQGIVLRFYSIDMYSNQMMFTPYPEVINGITRYVL